VGRAAARFPAAFPTLRARPHDTLNDVINGLDAELFKTCFASWIETLRDRAPDIIAIDGKTAFTENLSLLDHLIHTSEQQGLEPPA
jgi:hypothetical protein